MNLQSTFHRPELTTAQREALNLMIKALALLDCDDDGGTGATVHLSFAIDSLTGAKIAAELTSLEAAELVPRLLSYWNPIAQIPTDDLTLP